jgi:hypothetical protein
MTRVWGEPSQAVHRARLPLPRARLEHAPDFQPAAGHYLLAGVNAVLPQLGAGPAAGLADELRVALARTAACGDTCRVRPAADAVRLAATLLLNGSVEEAREQLQHVKGELLARPEPMRRQAERNQPT